MTQGIKFLCFLFVFVLAAQFLPNAAKAEIQLLDAVKDEPLELNFRANQEVTQAVQQFHSTGKNPYSGSDEIISQGQKLYKRNCQACHKKDGSGAVGPNLRDDEWIKARTDTEVGRFEIIYGGGQKGMQAFGKKLDQDDILKVMAFIDTFRSEEVAKKSAPKLPPKPPKKKKKVKSKPPVPFTEAYLSTAENVDAGGEFWAGQCRHCHGAKAYPGKAPKLKPAKYQPDFVYRRVTDGFRKMPAWKEQFSDDERMQIVAYILSSSFSP